MRPQLQFHIEALTRISSNPELRLNSDSAQRKTRLMALAKLLIAVVVIVFIGRSIWQARAQFAQQKFSLSQLRLGWLFLAGVFYLAGLLPMGCYWHRLLHAMGQRPTLTNTLRAYYLGHLGKYVPGKAMVLVIRAGMLKAAERNTPLVAASIFAETLTMMAVGAFLAAAMLLISFREQTNLLVLASALMLLAGAPTYPPLFRWLVRKVVGRRLGNESALSDAENGQESDVSKPMVGHLAAMSGFNFRVILLGWVANIVGWLLIALSLWATLRAIPNVAGVANAWQSLPRMLAATCLAVVAGFLSLLPGGLLVREWVITELLAPPYGQVVAIAAAVLVRLIWLMFEIAISVILYLGVRRRVDKVI